MESGWVGLLTTLAVISWFIRTFWRQVNIYGAVGLMLCLTFIITGLVNSPMRDAGIEDGSIIAVDRAIKPKHNSIVVAIVDGECTVKYLHQRAGRIKLRAANPTYPDIIPRDSQTIEVWGVVSGCVKLFLT